MAFRKLRQYSSKIDAPKTELDIDATIDETSDNAGRLKLVFERPRKNTVKVLLLLTPTDQCLCTADCATSCSRQ